MCQSVQINQEPGSPELGIVSDGTKCGSEMVCQNNECVLLSVAYVGQPTCTNNCNGNGICNENGNCHCNPGWKCPDCLETYNGPGGSINSGLNWENITTITAAPPASTTATTITAVPPASTISTTTEAVEKYYARIILNISFPVYLRNPENVEYISFKNNLETLISQLYSNNNNFVRVTINGFRQGSVLVYFMLEFKSMTNVPLAELQQGTSDGKLGNFPVEKKQP